MGKTGVSFSLFLPRLWARQGFHSACSYQGYGQDRGFIQLVLTKVMGKTGVSFSLSLPRLWARQGFHSACSYQGYGQDRGFIQLVLTKVMGKTGVSFSLFLPRLWARQGFHLENCPSGATGGIWILRVCGMIVEDVTVSQTLSGGSG